MDPRPSGVNMRLYNHPANRVPGNVGSSQAMRMNELLEQLKNEYEGAIVEMGRLKQVNEEYERKLEQQMNELDNIQRTLYDLQNNHNNLKHKYEEEIFRLRRQIDNNQASADQPNNNKRMRLDEPKREALPFPSSGGPSLMQNALPSIGRESVVSQSNPPPASSNGNFEVNEALTRLSSTLPLGGGPNGTNSHLPSQAKDEKPNLAPIRVPEGSGEGGFPRLPGATTQPPPLKVATSGTPSQQQTSQSQTNNSSAPPSQQSNNEPSGHGEPTNHQESVKKEGEKQGQETDQKHEVQDSDQDGDQEREGGSNSEGSREPNKPDWALVPAGDEIELIKTLHHSSVVCCVRFSNDGKYLATGSNKIAQVFDTVGDPVASFSTKVLAVDGAGDGDSYVRSVCFSPDSAAIAAGAEDKTIKIWDINSKHPIKSLAGHDSEIYSLDYGSNGKVLLSGSGDKTAKIWDLDTSKCVHELGATGPHAHQDGVTSVSLSPDCRYAATGSLDRMIRVYDVETGQLVHELVGHEEPVYSVVFSPDSNTLASGSLDKKVKLWDTASGKCRNSFAAHSDYVLSVAFAKNGDWLVSGSKDRTVAFWDPRITNSEAEPRLALQGHRNSVISVGMSGTDCLFATGSGDSRARLWNYDGLQRASTP